MVTIMLISSCLLLSCEAFSGPTKGTCQITTRIDSTLTPFVFPYTVNDPDEAFKLDKELEEISGLAMTPDSQFLLAVQDEDGIVFFLDPSNGKIKKEIAFWKDGDYEGIEVVGNKIFVVKSTGTLYAFDLDSGDEPEVEKHNGFLDGDHDVEGLAYDAKNNCLLIACKAASGAETEEPSKSIYAFRLEDTVLERDPIYCLRKSDVQEFLGLNPSLRKINDIVSFFDPDNSGFEFSPSALAIHPLTDDLYILSSVGKMLMVVGRNGSLKHIEKLSKKSHKQPEGIVFSPDGTLFISNEASGDSPVIYKYTYREK